MWTWFKIVPEGDVLLEGVAVQHDYERAILLVSMPLSRWHSSRSDKNTKEVYWLLQSRIEKDSHRGVFRPRVAVYWLRDFHSLNILLQLLVHCSTLTHQSFLYGGHLNIALYHFKNRKMQSIQYLVFFFRFDQLLCTSPTISNVREILLKDWTESYKYQNFKLFIHFSKADSSVFSGQHQTVRTFYFFGIALCCMYSG